MDRRCKECKHPHAKGVECTGMREGKLKTPIGPVIISVPCPCKVGA